MAIRFNSAARSQAGVTLLELVVAMSILAILVAMAAPSFREISLNSRSTNVINGLLGDLAMARSEAVKRARTTSVSAVAGGWNDGWVVWVDQNENNARDADETLITRDPINDARAATEIRYRLSAVQGAAAGGAAANRIAFGPMGQSVAPTASGARFGLCRPDGDAAKSTGIQIELSGRAASSKNLATLGLSC